MKDRRTRSNLYEAEFDEQVKTLSAISQYLPLLLRVNPSVSKAYSNSVDKVGDVRIRNRTSTTEIGNKGKRSNSNGEEIERERDSRAHREPIAHFPDSIKQPLFLKILFLFDSRTLMMAVPTSGAPGVAVGTEVGVVEVVDVEEEIGVEETVEVDEMIVEVGVGVGVVDSFLGYFGRYLIPVLRRRVRREEQQRQKEDVLGAIRFSKRDSRNPISCLNIPSSEVTVPHFSEAAVTTVPDGGESVILDRHILQVGERISLVRRGSDSSSGEPVVGRERPGERHRLDEVTDNFLFCRNRRNQLEIRRTCKADERGT